MVSAPPAAFLRPARPLLERIAERFCAHAAGMSEELASTRGKVCVAILITMVMMSFWVVLFHDTGMNSAAVMMMCAGVTLAGLLSARILALASARFSRLARAVSGCFPPLVFVVTLPTPARARSAVVLASHRPPRTCSSR
jgi:hypothetical protein